MEDAMRCERCGADIPEESSYCGQCGAPKPAEEMRRGAESVQNTAQEAASEPVDIEPSPQESEPSGSNSSRTCLWIGVGCAILFVIIMCLGLAFVFPFVRSLTQDMDLADIEALATAMVDFSEFEILEQDLMEFAVTPEPSEIPSPDVCFGVLCFSYPHGEDYRGLPSVLPAELETEWWAVPEHEVFTFVDYPLSDTFHQAQLAIYSVAEFLEVNPNAEESVAELNEFLKLQPESPESVPFVLPIFNAGQMIAAQVEYLEFEGGTGVRFVTQYGQAAWPINNQDLFYAFQGLTEDGEYLISAVLPVSHPSLPTDGEAYIGDDYEAFINNYEVYLLDVESNLNLEDPESFTPKLTVLDEMLETMEVKSP